MWPIGLTCTVLLATACASPLATPLIPTRQSRSSSGSPSNGANTATGGAGTSTTGRVSGSTGMPSDTTGGGNGASSGSGGNPSTGGTGNGSNTTTGGGLFACNLGDGGLFGYGITVGTSLMAPAHSYTRPLDVGDLNGDGNLDIVVADTGSGQVAVLFGNGDGTFQLPVLSNVAASNTGPSVLGPIDLHIAAMGAPAQMAVVLSDDKDGALLVESVNSSGELTPVSTLAGGNQGAAAMGFAFVADFNNDGIADVAGASGNGFIAFLGTDAGGYVAAGPLTSAWWCWEDCAGDFNGDGILDLLVVPSDEPMDGFSVHLGLGDGTFSDGGIRSDISGMWGTDIWLLGDLNEDGHLDALIYRESGDGSYIILLGLGDGTFAETIPSFVAAVPEVLRDLNGDGHLDFVGISQNNIWVTLGNGDSTFGVGWPSTIPSVGDAWRVVVGDVNNDGKPDLIATGTADTNVTVFLNNCR